MLVDFKNVNICQESKCVLENVNFHVDEGEFIYIIGKVGAGKSSLLKTMYCELDIESADCANVLDHNLLTIKRRQIPQLRKGIGIIFQDFQLLHDRTVYDNLRFVLRATGWRDKASVDDRINEVLDAVGMSDAINKMPHQLSGGEQQRIAISRALLNTPKIIIADESTGILDVETVYNIVSLLKSISQKGTAVIMSTHNIPMIDKYPGIVYSCQNGTLEEQDIDKMSM